MAEFFKWLSANPIATVYFNLAITIFGIIIMVLLHGYEIKEISVSPPKITMKAKESRKTVQIGHVPFPDQDPKAKEFYDPKHIFKGVRDVHQNVQFDPPFKKQPDYVAVSLQKIDAGSDINRLEVYTANVGKKSFDLHFKTWDDSIVYSASATWIAIGE